MLLTLSHDLRHYFGLGFLSCRLGHKFKQDFSRPRQENTNLVVILLLFIITEPAEMRLFNDFTIDLALEGIKLGISDAKERKGKIRYLDPHRHHPSPAQHYRSHPTWTDFAHNA